MVICFVDLGVVLLSPKKLS